MIQDRSQELTCPRCGASGQIPIVYGYPTDETSERARVGEVAIGGCMPFPADTGCSACGLEWVAAS